MAVPLNYLEYTDTPAKDIPSDCLLDLLTRHYGYWNEHLIEDEEDARLVELREEVLRRLSIYDRQYANLDTRPYIALCAKPSGASYFTIIGDDMREYYDTLRNTKDPIVLKGVKLEDELSLVKSYNLHLAQRVSYQLTKHERDMICHVVNITQTEDGFDITLKRGFCPVDAFDEQAINDYIEALIDKKE